MKLFQIVIVVILLIGVVVGIYLVGNPTRFLPKAASEPIGPSPTAVSHPIENSPSPVFIPGDVDRDGDVDIFDFNFLVTDFGKVESNNKSDFNQNGKVDIFDFNTLVSNFGRKK